MRAFLIACAAAVVIAVVSAGALGVVQESAERAFSTTSVRL
jgi:hypothetical protein